MHLKIVYYILLFIYHLCVVCMYVCAQACMCSVCAVQCVLHVCAYVCYVHRQHST